MKRDWHPLEHQYKKGIATGRPDIREDAIVFRWRDEVYVVPTWEAQPIMDQRGENIFAKRSAIRKLVKADKAYRFHPKYEADNG